jgi:hypothetical protein
MSAVSEEDVLAVLTLNAALESYLREAISLEDREATNEGCAAWAVYDGYERAVTEICMDRVRAQGTGADRFDRAVADSERRYAVECAEREVLEAVRDGYRVPLENWGEPHPSGRPGIWARLMGAEGDRRVAIKGSR